MVDGCQTGEVGKVNAFTTQLNGRSFTGLPEVECS
jgi:hypothetical protein